jgi:hypothetical protein
MDPTLQWAITAVTGILGILAGRAWARLDRRSAVDRELLSKFNDVLPIGSEYFVSLRRQDFGADVPRDFSTPLRNLSDFLAEPSFFFLDKQLEANRRKLALKLHDFLELYYTEMFTKDANQELLSLIKPEESITLRVRRLDKRPTDEECHAIEVQARQRYDETRKRLNEMSAEICEIYDKMFSIARYKV